MVSSSCFLPLHCSCRWGKFQLGRVRPSFCWIHRWWRWRVSAVAPPPPPLDVSQWPKSEEQRRPSSRGTQPVNQLYIYKEIIKARPIKLQNRSIYMLIIRSDSAFLLFSCQQPVYIWFNSKHTIQLMVWEVGTESPCVYENSREKCSKDKASSREVEMPRQPWRTQERYIDVKESSKSNKISKIHISAASVKIST